MEDVVLRLSPSNTFLEHVESIDRIQLGGVEIASLRYWYRLSLRRCRHWCTIVWVGRNSRKNEREDGESGDRGTHSVLERRWSGARRECSVEK